eukprot:748727-Hanusia_phi.AAC.6
MLELLDMLDQVTYLELPEHVQGLSPSLLALTLSSSAHVAMMTGAGCAERFVRSGTTKELWNTHHDHPEGGMRLLWERGIHYDTLLKTKWWHRQEVLGASARRGGAHLSGGQPPVPRRGAGRHSLP